MADNQNNTNPANAMAELQARLSAAPKPKKHTVPYKYSDAETAILAKKGVGVTHSDLMTLAQSDNTVNRCAALGNPAFKKADLTKRLVICSELKQAPEVRAILCNSSLKFGAIRDWANDAHDPNFLKEVFTPEVNAKLAARLATGK